LANYHHTEGICLRRIDYSNTSQVASFLTPDSGRLSVLAKGVTRAPKRGIRTGFDLLGRYDLIYTARRYGSLQNLTYRWLKEDFHGLRSALERVICGYYAAELALNFATEGDPCPGLYELMLRSLRNLAAGKKLGVTVLLLELGVLREHGACPTFGACAECGRALPGRGPVPFSPADGGPLCRDCEMKLRAERRWRVTAVSAGVLRQLATLSAQTDADPDAAPLSPKATVAMSAVLRFHMRDLLARELRMWKYLGRQELSRSLTRLRRGSGLRGRTGGGQKHRL
jgi:DNA repair protein RecO (recombination protein O)